MSTDGLVALSVLGPRGMVDLVVPGEAVVGDVATEYARQTGLPTPLPLSTELGTRLSASAPLEVTGVSAGDVLVAATDQSTDDRTVSSPDNGAGDVAPTGSAGARRGGSGLEVRSASSAAVVVAVVVAAVAAVAAAWSATRLDDAADRRLVADILLAAAVLGVLPGGRAPLRAAAAPAFAAGAAYAFAWRPDPAALPAVLGMAGLAAAATAAAGRALVFGSRAPAPGDTRRDEPLLVCVVSGLVLFALGTLVTVGGLSPAVAWSLLLLTTMLGARAVPALVVDVPDQVLVDLERLAVSAWSARDRPRGRRGRRGRMVVTADSVAAIADRGQRLVLSASLAIAVLAPLSAVLLVGADLPPLDDLGATLLSFFVGGSLLLVANSYRNLAARRVLQVGGLLAWAPVAAATLPASRETAGPWLVLGSVLVGCGCVAAAVAAGRGWRSAWWARRAEVAESVCGACAIGSLCLSTGLFRLVWEFTSRFAQ